jgi:nucleoside-diphosphate-sugar epimerase
VLGNLESPDEFSDVAASCDAVIHLGSHQGPTRATVDRLAVESLLAALNSAHAPKAFIYTSVLFVLGNVKNMGATEETAPRPPEYARYKAEQEHLVLRSGSTKMSTTVIRPGMVYGGGNGGAVSELFRSAVAEGHATYIGDGANRWSLVHRDDLAALFQIVVEERIQGILHAIDGHPLSVHEIAQRAGFAAGGERGVRAVPLEEGRMFLGSFADALCLDQPAAAPRAVAHGWRLTRPMFAGAVDGAFAEWQAEQE